MEDLSFIPDLPSGPLDEYRDRATFDWKQLKVVLEGNLDLLKLKYKIWHTLEKDPLFAHSSITPSVEEQKRLTQLKVNRINDYKFLTEEVARSNYSNKTRTIMTINEAIQCISPSVSVKMALGIYLFSNALLSLGTERHRHFYEATLYNREVLSCLALTEVAHGSDARLMRTTATYDASHKHFLIHTPDFEAAKCWVGNLGRTCTHALLFAQLITPDGTNHGLHAFVVPIRNPDTLETYPGLIVGDMGEKIGLNGIDNGFIMFNKYRIPRENLLNRTADVTEAGEYESSFSEPSRILGAALENLSAGRVGIMQESCHTISSAVVIATRYAATRKQFGTADNEIPLLEYELHQWRLFRYVAAAVVFKIYIHEFTAVYLDTVEKSNRGDKIDNLSDVVSELHAIVSCSKPLITWSTLLAAQECREACGGNGYLKCANLGELRSNHDPSVTYEGDNNVLSQQAGNWLLRQLESVDTSQEVYSPLGTVDFLPKYKEILQRKYNSKDNVESTEFIISTYQWLLCWILQETNNKYQEELSKGLDKFHAKAKSQVYRWKVLTQVYAEYLALIFYLRKLKTIEFNVNTTENSIKTTDKCHKATNFEQNATKNTENLKVVLKNLFIMYGLTSLEKHLVVLYEGGYCNGDLLAQNLRNGVLDLCEKLRDEVLGVVDALAPTDFVLNSVLGKADGNLYQNLQKELFHNPGTFERATWWREVVKSKL